jgi:hypothetical protein
MSLPSDLVLPYAHLGVLLQAIREQYAVRLTEIKEASMRYPDDGPSPHDEMSIPALVIALEREGCNISALEYLQVEAGDIRRDDIAYFIDAFARCLKLDSDELQALRAQLAFDILTSELGEALAWEIIRDAVKRRGSAADTEQDALTRG